jgi:hypothetical protein
MSDSVVGWMALVMASIALGVVFPLMSQFAALRKEIEQITAGTARPGDV